MPTKKNEISYLDYREYLKKKKTNKYGAEASQGFPSRLERDTHAFLEMLQNGGRIKEIRRYPRVRLTESVFFKPDFQVTAPDDQVYYVEAKGFETDGWRIKKKLWKDFGPAPLHIYKRCGRRGVKCVEIVFPQNKR